MHVHIYPATDSDDQVTVAESAGPAEGRVIGLAATAVCHCTLAYWQLLMIRTIRLRVLSQHSLQKVKFCTHAKCCLPSTVYTILLQHGNVTKPSLGMLRWLTPDDRGSNMLRLKSAD